MIQKPHAIIVLNPNRIATFTADHPAISRLTTAWFRRFDVCSTLVVAYSMLLTSGYLYWWLYVALYQTPHVPAPGTIPGRSVVVGTVYPRPLLYHRQGLTSLFANRLARSAVDTAFGLEWRDRRMTSSSA